MKYLLFVFLSFAALKAKAQIGYKQLLVSGGISTFNTKVYSIQLEGAGTHKVRIGVLLETLLYSNNKNFHFSVRYSKIFQSLGFYVKGDVHDARNFCATWFVGGAVGSNIHDIIVYPVVGIEQGWFIYPKTQLFLSEKLLYLRNIDLKNLVQPTLQIGFKYSI